MTDDASLRQRAFALFQEACDLPAGARDAFLDDACGTDAELRAAVEALLALDAESDSFLNDGLRLGPPAEVPAPAEVLGGYRVVGELGRGGMGVVYAAERVDGTFEKTVALKLVGAGAASEEAIRRFERERRVLARLEHPGIARLLDGGVAPDGRPYFIMERVEGEPITDYAEARALDLDTRLALLLGVCEAVAHAHRLLIVHRDLKPSNVFVTETASGPQVKLLDFGIAKALDDEEDDLLTRTGAALTPAYAAPEQVTGAPVTAATDVYALGVLAYELLVGRRPYHFPNRALAEVARVVRESEPTRPSTAVDTLPAGDRQQDEIAWHAPARRLRGDLDAIVMQALRKEPERRYATAADLAADLRRHVDGLPVEARGDSLGYRASRFVRRNKTGVGAAGALVLALVVGVGAVLWQARETTREADRANATLDYVLGMFEAVDPVELEDGDLSPAALLAPGLRQAAALDAQPLVQASLLEGLGRLGVSLGEFGIADSVLSRAVEVRQRVQGEGHPDLGPALTLLTESRTAERRYDEAMTTGQRAVRLLGATGGDALAEARLALAEVYYRIDSLDASKPLYRRAFEGASEPEIRVAALSGLAVQLEDDSLDAALPAYQEAADLAARTFGTDDARTADVYYNHASALQLAGDTTQASVLHERALATYERVYGSGDYRTGRSLYTLAVLHHTRQPETAEAYYRRALVAYEGSAFEADHLWAEYVRVALGGLLLREGRPDAALPLLDAGVGSFTEQLGPDDLRTLNARAGRGLAYVQTGQATRGLAELNEVIRLLEVEDPGGAYHLAVLDKLAEALDASGQGDQARAVAQQRAALTDG